jgi:hypothetical protein
LPFKILIHPNPQISLVGVSLVSHSSTTIMHSMPALQTTIYGETLEGAQNHKLFLTLGVALLMKPQVILTSSGSVIV